MEKQKIIKSIGKYILGSILLFWSLFSNAQIYVKHDASGMNNGTNWTNAYNNLQDAIDAATAGNQIWVAVGTYTPTKDHMGNATPSDARTKTFHISKIIQIYGGFSGMETNLNQRNVMTNVTILNGDLGGNDLANPTAIAGNSLIDYPNTSDNAYRVIYIHSLLSNMTPDNTVLDGFTVRGGNASISNSTVYYDTGSGLYIRPTASFSCSPSIANCTFRYNDAVFKGAGIYINSIDNGLIANPEITDCTFEANIDASGAAIGSDAHGSSTCSPIIKNCKFKSNIEGVLGGGIIKCRATGGGTSNPKIIQCIFNSNQGCSVFNHSADASSTATMDIINCVFYDNTLNIFTVAVAQNDAFNGGTSNLTMTNSVIWSNGTAVLMNNGGTFDINHSIFHDGVTDGVANLPTGVTGNSITEIDPNFTNATADDFTLSSCSPAIHAGDGTSGNSVNTETTDFAGNPRFYTGFAIDLGVYEKNPMTNTTGIVYVNINATGANTGASWTDAYTSLHSAMSLNCSDYEIWIAAGTYLPTLGFDANGSGIIESGEETFYLNKNLKLYGGFVGTETTLSQRNISANPTILSGDIGVANDSTDNAYHVVFIEGNATSNDLNITFDGLSIEEANANHVPNLTNLRGGGIYCRNATNSKNLNLTINECTIRNNYAQQGSAFYFSATNSSWIYPTITQSVIHDNTTIGGNIYFYTESGGWIIPRLTNCILHSNATHLIYSETLDSNNGNVDLLAMNCTIVDNPAPAANSALITNTSYNIFNLKNCIIWGNTYFHLINNGTTLHLENCIAFDNIIDGVLNVGTFGTTSSNSIEADPLFIDAANHNYRLAADSPARNIGLSAGAPNIDIDGFSRPYGSGFDLGVYETPPFIFVKKNAVGENNGNSWSNAYTNLQDAITNYTVGFDIWVAAGTYYTDDVNSGGDLRGYSFNIQQDGIKIYGGFAGTETELSQRNVSANETILSGDIGVQNNNSDNAYTVVKINANSISSNTVLNGFTIRDGNSENDASQNGGGLFISKAEAGMTVCPTIANIIFTENRADEGGGVYINQSTSGTAGAVFSNCTFKNNYAGQGSCVYSAAFSPNNGTVSTNFFNCLFADNTALGGNAVYHYNSPSSDPTPTINTTKYVNCIFVNNASIAPWIFGDVDIYHSGYTGTVKTNFENCVLWSSNSHILAEAADAAFYYCDIRDGAMDGNINLPINYTYANCIDSDPLFVDTANGDYSLQSTSPAIDAGNNTYNTYPLDLANNQRISNITIDIGAYEYQFVLPVVWLDFTAYLNNNNQVKLVWEVASERNNSHFEVEHSTEAFRFEKVGEIASFGTNDEVESYDFLHLTPQTGNNYYRLKQIDLDGQFEYSKVVVLNYLPATYKYRIFPNPTSGFLIVETEEPTIIQIINQLGQIVSEKKLTHTEQIDISNLPSATYWIKINHQFNQVIIKN